MPAPNTKIQSASISGFSVIWGRVEKQTHALIKRTIAQKHINDIVKNLNIRLIVFIVSPHIKYILSICLFCERKKTNFVFFMLVLKNL